MLLVTNMNSFGSHFEASVVQFDFDSETKLIFYAFGNPRTFHIIIPLKLCGPYVYGGGGAGKNPALFRVNVQSEMPMCSECLVERPRKIRC